MEEHNLGKGHQDERTDPAIQPAKNNNVKNRKKKEKRNRKKAAEEMAQQNLENAEQTNISEKHSIKKRLFEKRRSLLYKLKLISDRFPTEEGSSNQNQALHLDHSSSVQGSQCRDRSLNEPQLPHDAEGSSNDNRTSKISLVIPDHLKLVGSDAPPVIAPTDVQPDDPLDTNRPNASSSGETNPTGTQQYHQATDSSAQPAVRSAGKMTEAAGMVEEPYLGNDKQDERTDPAPQTAKNNNAKNRKKKEKNKMKKAAARMEEPNLGNRKQEATDAPNPTEENIPKEMAAESAVGKERKIENLEKTNSCNDQNRRKQNPSFFSYDEQTEAYLCARKATTNVNRNTSAAPVFDSAPRNANQQGRDLPGTRPRDGHN